MRRRQRNALGPEATGLDLFPFLSIFLCVMGVLSFLNLVGAAAGPRTVLLNGDAALGHKSAYRILCTGVGLIALPPVARLPAGDPVLDAIRDARLARRAALGAVVDPARTEPAEPDAMLAILTEVDRVNRLSAAAGLDYREFLLFGIYPGGAGTYHAFRRLRDDHPDLNVAVGLEPLDPAQRVALDAPPGAPSAGAPP